MDMRHITGRRLCGQLILLIVLSSAVSAQNNRLSRVLPVQDPSGKDVLPCRAGTNFETEKYKIAHTEVNDPFRFLYWIGRKSNTVESQLASMLDNKPFTYTMAETDALTLIENASFAPNLGTGFVIRVELVSVRNCDPNAKTLDLVYRIYSSNPPKAWGAQLKHRLSLRSLLRPPPA